MAIIALPLFAIVAAIQTTPQYESFTVTEVRIEERFAGQYGTADFKTLIRRGSKGTKCESLKSEPEAR